MWGRRSLVAVSAAAAVAGVFVAGVLVAGSGPEASRGPLSPTGPGAGRYRLDYLVFYAPGRKAEAVRAVQEAGGTAGEDEPKLGYLVVRGMPPAFPEKAAATSAIVGITPNRRMGATDALRGMTAGREARYAPIAAPAERSPEATIEGRVAASGMSGVPKAEPLASRQWDMKMIGATRTGSYAKAPGSHKVLVGIIDTGIDGRHPDIAPNFNRALSRNFVQDIPRDAAGEMVDGPCESDGCVDPADVDDDGHGTHVAGIIGSPVNGLGVAGVAPGVSLVNLRAGQDSGYFFLKPTMDALTYAGDTGIDVVNMSFYIDPWLFNCGGNPADSRAQQLEQAGILAGVQRALDYAGHRDVTLISALGNGASDLGKITTDAGSPDYPRGARHTRKIDGSCLSVPTESHGVISVSALGPSGRKSFFSDYGMEQADLSAPGGDAFDTVTGLPGNERQILAAAPEKLLRAQGRIRADGEPKDSTVVRDCHDGTCGYYQYLEGTSMAAPHAAGVAAILISRFGRPGRGGLTMAPAAVEKLLYATAVQKACPSPRAYHYPGDKVHVCEGAKARNGFYGHGVVNARRAATVER